MRRTLLVPLMVALFGAASWDPSGPAVSAQVGTFRVAPVERSTQTIATVDEMIARVMSFDDDGDGAVGPDELVDRMRPLLEEGDRDGDGVLDRAEVRALASAPRRPKASLGFPFSGGYSLGDDIGFSSRSHIEGAIEDLRLDSETRDRALGVVAAFMDAVESHASATLLEELEPLLTSSQLSTVRGLLDRQAATFLFRAPGLERRVVTLTPRLEDPIGQFGLEPSVLEAALAAVEQYRESIRPGDEERPVLLAALGGILDDEQRENFRAAIERRPVVSGLAGFGVSVGATIRVEPNVTVGGSIRKVRAETGPTLVDAPVGSPLPGR